MLCRYHRIEIISFVFRLYKKYIPGASKKNTVLKMFTKENLLAIDCNFTIVYFIKNQKKVFRQKDCLTRYLNRFMIISYPSRYIVIK